MVTLLQSLVTVWQRVSMQRAQMRL
uniref:Uncharacterized protein n=1 Tax=Arundo donax TaxID=35708 RepID=A0A0A9AS06_ARUDO